MRQVSDGGNLKPDLLKIFRREISQLGAKDGILLVKDGQPPISLAHIDREALKSLCSNDKIHRPSWLRISPLSGRPFLYSKRPKTNALKTRISFRYPKDSSEGL